MTAATDNRPSPSATKASRARLKGQKPTILWFTGLSASGKTTLATLVEAHLLERQAHSILLDGDDIRRGLNRDLGFGEADRAENSRRVGEVAKLMLDAGLFVLCAFISPFAADRRLVRDLVGPDEFIEVFVDTPLDVCMRRDPKGLYRRALAGELTNFTGVDQAYESPLSPELVIRDVEGRAHEAARTVMAYLEARGAFSISG